MSLPRDIQEFLREYPGFGNDLNNSVNWEFYSELPLGKDQKPRRCVPNNMTITEVHAKWFANPDHGTQYATLEREHGYIQWLFPIRESGMNFSAMPLEPHEIDKMKGSPTVIERIIKSYTMMLDFYGMRLLSHETGLIDRSENCASRYHNLLRRSHNWLRISRILKCLSELGLERLNAGFLLHILNEQSESNLLNSRAIQESMDRWWANCIRNQEEREQIGLLIRKVRANDDFVFTRKMYEGVLERRQQTGKLVDT